MYSGYWKPTKVNYRGMLGRSITVQAILFVIVVIAIFSSNERDMRSVSHSYRHKLLTLVCRGSSGHEYMLDDNGNPQEEVEEYRVSSTGQGTAPCEPGEEWTRRRWTAAIDPVCQQ